MWFVSMGAVVETAIFTCFEYFGEEMRYLVLIHLDSAEPSHSGGIDNISALIAREPGTFRKM